LFHRLYNTQLLASTSRMATHLTPGASTPRMNLAPHSFFDKPSASQQ
jgi:hypothetical protein